MLLLNYKRKTKLIVKMYGERKVFPFLQIDVKNVLPYSDHQISIKLVHWKFLSFVFFGFFPRTGL